MDSLTTYIYEEQQEPVTDCASRITISLTPEEVASQFASMTDLEMARFFNHLGRKVLSWKKPFDFQMAGVERMPILTDAARDAMRCIGEYSMKVRKNVA